MATFLSSATYRKIIADKYGREPIEYAAQGSQQYEDLEFVRSKAYEAGKMAYVGATEKESADVKNIRSSRVIQNMNGSD